MKIKKINKVIVSSLLALSMAGSVIPLTVSAATKSGNTNETTITNKLDALQNQENPYGVNISNSNGWEIKYKENGSYKTGTPTKARLDSVGLVDDVKTVKTLAQLKTALSEKPSKTGNYRYVNVTADISLTGNITIPNHTILFINQGTDSNGNQMQGKITGNNKNINIESNVLIIGTKGKSVIEDSSIIIESQNNISIGDIILKTKAETTSSINQRIFFKGNCSDIVVRDSTLGNNSNKSYATRILFGSGSVSATITNFKMYGCTVSGGSPYIIRTGSKARINGLQISSNTDLGNKKIALSGLTNNKSNNIYLADTKPFSLDLNYTKNIHIPSITTTLLNTDINNCDNFKIEPSKINGKLTIQNSSSFRIYNTNVSDTTEISSSNNFRVYSTKFTGKVTMNDCYYFMTSRKDTSACFNNIFNNGLNLDNCRNFILSECKIPVGLTIKSNNNYNSFTIKTTYVNNVTINKMNNFTINSSCVRQTKKTYSLSGCSKYKNYSRYVSNYATSHTHS